MPDVGNPLGRRNGNSYGRDMAADNDKSAPMASAPMKYTESGEVDWGNMWDSFCALPREGGPPHRATMLLPEENGESESEAYERVVREITRGIYEVSGMRAEAGPQGWIAILCPSAGMARWLTEAIIEENVQARHDGKTLLVPAGASYTLKGEIKNVVTAVAKTTHYWADHLHPDVKRTFEFQERLSEVGSRISGIFRRRSA